VRVLRDRLDRGAAVALADVAAALHVSERTLQRQLAAAGTSLRAELDGVRRTIALARLREERCPVAEIATALGFADQAQFSRAVRRWTGMPPTAIRRGGA
jgi:AraC-like DNA-binding protein